MTARADSPVDDGEPRDQARVVGRDAREGLLWAAFRESGLPEARADLFRAYQPLARRIAVRQFRTRAGADVELNDLLQLAHAGLLEAIDLFNPDFGVPFKFYGNRRILGCVLDGLARMTEVRAQARSRHAVRQERLRSLKSTEPVAGGSHLDQAIAQLGAIAGELAIGFILEDYGFLSDMNVVAPETPYDSLAWRQMERRLAAELELLGARDRTVLTYHYLGAVSFAEIAEMLHLSAGRISQIHKSRACDLTEKAFDVRHYGDGEIAMATGSCPDFELQTVLAVARENPADGIAQLGGLLNRFPDDARLHFLHGSLLAGAQRYEEGIEAMARAVGLAPTYVLARFQLGFLQLTCGKADAAQATWTALLALPESDPFKQFVRGLGHLIRDEFAETIERLEAGMALNQAQPLVNNDMQLIVDEVRQRMAAGAAPVEGAMTSATQLLFERYSVNDTSAYKH